MSKTSSSNPDSSIPDSSYLDVDSPPNAAKRYETSPQSLCDKLAVLPFHWHWFRMLANSFFARRLLCTGLVLSIGLAVGLLVYNRSAPSRFDTDSVRTGDSCDAIVAVSAPVYNALPYAFVLFLPASGLRWFDPFKKKEAKGSPTSRMIRRGLLFQAMELLAVYMLFKSTLVALFLPGFIFVSGSISCNSFRSQMLALGACAGYGGIFALLYYFARYRDHIMMQIGAFQESDQTGNFQRHAKTDFSELESTKKVASVIRTRLYHATRRGDLQEMRDVLEYAKTTGLDLCSLYTQPKIRLKFFARSRRNPVHLAAYHGNVRALELLEEYCLDMATLDKFGRVRFSTGSFFWYFFRFLIKRQPNSDDAKSVSIFQTTLVTPLHCAVSTGQLEAVRWLLGRGVPPDTLAQASFRSNRVPPLFLADHAAVARELLIHGANPLVIPDPGFLNTVTPLQLAYVRGNATLAQELEEWGGDVALTPFHMAAARNDVVAVRKYLLRKTEVDCLGEMDYVGLHRRTPLHWAAISGATEAVAMLLQGGAAPNFQDICGRSPLHWAARLNKVEVVRLLLRAGADPNLTDEAHRTPLMCASSALNASRELYSELTAAGGDISYQLPTTGDTALHLAVQEGNEASALAALENGGDIMCTNSEGLRPLDCTTSVQLLFELKRAAGQRDVMISYTHSHLEFARKLRQSLEEANVTTWLDLMDPSGIGGGSVWREEIARGITNASVVLCILTEDYASSEWCLKELALAKQVGTPILAVSTEGAVVDENLQVYLYTRQIVPFEPAIVRLRQDEGRVEYDYDEDQYERQLRLLLDGVRDEIEKYRHLARRKNVANAYHRLESTGFNRGTMVASVIPKAALPETYDSPKFVFLSHGDKHQIFVQRLTSELSEAGITFYSDQSVEGQHFQSRIQTAQTAILQCTCFVVLVSRQTMESELVRDQLAFAEDKGRAIFPVVLNDLNPGLDKRYSLARNKLFHFMANGMNFQDSSSLLIEGLKCLECREPQ